MNRYTYLTFILLMVCTFLKAQTQTELPAQLPTPAQAQEVSFYHRYILSYPTTSFAAFEAPAKWGSKDWIKAAGVVAVGSGLYLFDEDINKIIQRNRSRMTSNISVAGNLVGNGWSTIPLIGATWVAGYAFKSPKTKDTALLCTKSLLLASGFTAVLKVGTQRYRPNKDRGSNFWNGQGFNRRRDSFPSGHTTLVWSIAPVLAEQYRATGWVPPVVYSIACITGFSRLNDEKHWTSDVFVGTVIGYSTAQIVMKTTPRLTVLPTIEPAGIQLGWQY